MTKEMNGVKSMNIFIAFFSAVYDPLNPYAIPCFYETFIQKLEDLGNNICVYVSKSFGAEFRKIPSQLLSDIKEFNPDLVILFNNAFYDISKEVECPILIYEVDSPLYYSNKEALKNNGDRYKFVVCQDESIETLISEFKISPKNIIKVPFFTEIQPKKFPFSNNICFIGSRFFRGGISPYKKFIDTEPSQEEKEQYYEILKYLKKNPWIKKEDIIEIFSNVSVKVQSTFDLDKINCCLSDFNRRIVLSSIADLGLDLYGDPYWEKDNYNEADLIMSYKNKPIYSFKHNEDVYNSCKIGININHRQAISGFSWRVCDIMASNACLVSEYKSDIKKYFGNIIPTFESPFEAREICVKLLKDEVYRREIVEKSNEIINQKFRFNNVLPILEEFCGVPLRNNKEGYKTFILESEKRIKPIKLKYKIMKKIYDRLEKKLRRKGMVD